MEILQKFGRRLWKAHLNFQDHEGTLSASGIAFYVALSFFPLLLVLVAGLSWILQWTQVGQNAWQTLHQTIANQSSPDLAQQVGRTLRTVSDRAPANGPIGFLVLLASAIAIFAQLDAAFDRIVADAGGSTRELDGLGEAARVPAAERRSACWWAWAGLSSWRWSHR